MSRYWIVGVLLFSLVWVQTGHVQTSKESFEYTLKGYQLFKILAYINWEQPSSNKDSNKFIITLLGKDPFGSLLDDLAKNQKNNGRAIVINRCNRLEELQPTDVLFICESESAHLDNILKYIEGWNVLTVGDTAGFARRGVIINFFVDKTVSFEVNLPAAKKAKIKVDATVLNLKKVRVIRETEIQGD